MKIFNQICKPFFAQALSLFLFLLFALVAVSAQEEVIRIDTDLIVFEVTVTDREGKPLDNLEEKDFTVLENGKERRIDFFSRLKKSDASRPLSIVFVLDVSGSVSSAETEKLQTALRNFLSYFNDYNASFSVMTFGMNVKTLQGFTNKREKIEKSLEKLFREQDGLSSHAYDAVDAAIRNLRKNSPPRIKGRFPKKTVILITDGFPVGDTVSPQTVIERANEAETTVSAIILPSYSKILGNKKPLPTPLEAGGLIEKTGGQIYYAGIQDFSSLFKSLAEEITSSYILAFYPSDESRQKGKFNEVKINASKGYRIRQNRQGYQIKKVD